MVEVGNSPVRLLAVAFAASLLIGCAAAPAAKTQPETQPSSHEQIPADPRDISRTVTLEQGYFSDQLQWVVIELGFNRGVLTPEADAIVGDMYLEAPVTFSGTPDEVINQMLSGVPIKAIVKAYDRTVVFVPEY